jgi:hypothetical protein
MLRLRLLALAALLAPAPLAAQGATERGAFVVRLGSDTLAVERYTRSGTRFESDIAARIPRTRRMHYTGTLNPDGTMAQLRIIGTPVSQGPGQLPPLDATLVFGKDSARTTLKIGDSTQVVAAAIQPGVMPVTTFSFALYELIAMRARRNKADSVSVQVLGLGANQTFESYAVRRGPDAMDIGYFGSPMHLKLDRNGRVLSVDGRETTSKVIVERVATVDVDRAARDFAVRDAAGQGVGQLSERDTVTASAGGATLTIDYGRPHRRGREIFGAVVPWGQVWRTGANAATGLTIDRDLTINGTAIPKGSYTLFTLPTPSGTKLIVNKQTGQWGTQYDEHQDFARIDLAAEQLGDPLEVFTIGVEPKDRGGVLTLAWDRTRFSAPFEVR